MHQPTEAPARADAAMQARRLWPLAETVHAVVYFAAEHRDAMAALGLKGFWMGYFASRAAPMGAVGPAVVEATFHNFHPRMVQRALPDAWALGGDPDRVLAARARAVESVLRRILGDALTDPALQRAAEGLWRLAADAPAGGRPIGAANQALPKPTDPHLVLWQACTTLRELRGDGHVIALTAADVDGLTAHVLKVAAADGVDRDAMAVRLRQVRGFSDAEWNGAVGAARARGILTEDGGLTQHGRALVDQVEDQTDHLAASALAGATPDDVNALLADLRVPVDVVLAAQEIPFPNPIGMPRP